MTSKQKFIVALLCLAPVLIGAAVLVSSESKTASSFSFKKIGLVQLTDVIMSSEPYVTQLRAFREDASVAGVLLHIDSPGGASVPSQEIFSEVKKFRDINKPLVVSVGNMAASGGYYIASPAMKIFANKSSITGSIGVIFKFPQYYKLLDKLGVSMQVYKSGDMKDVGSPDRHSTPQDSMLIQGIINDIHEQFIQDVATGRSMNADSLRKIADGRIFTGKQALKVHLIDTIGSYEDALAYIKSYAGVSPKSQVIEKKKRESLLKNMLYNQLADHFPFLKSVNAPAGSYFLFKMGF